MLQGLGAGAAMAKAVQGGTGGQERRGQKPLHLFSLVTPSEQEA